MKGSEGIETSAHRIRTATATESKAPGFRDRCDDLEPGSLFINSVAGLHVLRSLHVLHVQAFRDHPRIGDLSKPHGSELSREQNQGRKFTTSRSTSSGASARTQ